MPAFALLAKTALELVWPRACAGCGRDGMPVLCEGCARDAERAPARIVDGLDAVEAAFAHEAAPRAALLAVKLAGQRRGARDLAAWLGSAGIVDAVAWVPDDARTRAQRGGSPTRELARAYARRLGVPAIAALRRRSKGIDLGGLRARDRRAAVEGAFVASRRVPARIALVDDVVTSGATARACALALRGAGARRIVLVTFTSATWRAAT